MDEIDKLYELFTTFATSYALTIKIYKYLINNNMVIKDDFTTRHNGPSCEEAQKMLQTIGVKSMDELIEKTVPAAIRLPKPLDLPEGMQEGEYLNLVNAKMAKNKMYRSFIGMGHYNTYTPAVILRNVFENPGWYTAYTPYQVSKPFSTTRP